MKLKLTILLFTSVIFIFCISCGQLIQEIEKATAGEEKEPKLETEEKIDTKEEKLEVVIEPIEKIELPGPIPEKGYGNVAGRIFFNSQPVDGAKLILCEKFSTFSGCEGAKYEAISNEKGIYCIESIPPGDYALVCQLPGEENYLYAGNFIKGAAKIKVVEGTTTPLENIHAYRTDLKLISPQDKEEIDSRNPTLKWESYNSTKYYHIYLAPEAGDIGKLIDEKTNESNFEVKESLLSCKFTWKIEAFNQYGRKIAESEYYNFFVKVDCPSCYLKLLTPADKEKIKQGITITLSWKEHPMADKYNLSVKNTETNEYVVDFVKIDSTSYEVTETIPEGEYYWGVFVVDSFGTNIAYGAGYFKVIK